MNRAEFISRIRQLMGPGATRRAATAAADAVLSSLAELAAEAPLHLTHFGTFEQKQHAATRGYSIPRGGMAERAAYRALSFRPSESLLAFAALCPLPRPHGNSKSAATGEGDTGPEHGGNAD